ncbi:hypothetical protein AAFC00_002148 [Neodothiora populina]|uniref:SET domain-containing protein n=1 Tax=Neodothiora populina TaxID=2781224 RepID=A0ABR3PGF7_9PEZI
MALHIDLTVDEDVRLADKSAIPRPSKSKQKHSQLSRDLAVDIKHQLSRRSLSGQSSRADLLGTRGAPTVISDSDSVSIATSHGTFRAPVAFSSAGSPSSHTTTVTQSVDLQKNSGEAKVGDSIVNGGLGMSSVHSGKKIQGLIKGPFSDSSDASAMKASAFTDGSVRKRKFQDDAFAKSDSQKKARLVEDSLSNQTTTSQPSHQSLEGRSRGNSASINRPGRGHEVHTVHNKPAACSSAAPSTSSRPAKAHPANGVLNSEPRVLPTPVNQAGRPQLQGDITSQSADASTSASVKTSNSVQPNPSSRTELDNILERVLGRRANSWKRDEPAYWNYVKDLYLTWSTAKRNGSKASLESLENVVKSICKDDEDSRVDYPPNSPLSEPLEESTEWDSGTTPKNKKGSSNIPRAAHEPTHKLTQESKENPGQDHSRRLDSNSHQPSKIDSNEGALQVHSANARQTPTSPERTVVVKDYNEIGRDKNKAISPKKPKAMTFSHSKTATANHNPDDNTRRHPVAHDHTNKATDVAAPICAISASSEPIRTFGQPSKPEVRASKAQTETTAETHDSIQQQLRENAAREKKVSLAEAQSIMKNHLAEMHRDHEYKVHAEMRRAHMHTFPTFNTPATDVPLTTRYGMTCVAKSVSPFQGMEAIERRNASGKDKMIKIEARTYKNNRTTSKITLGCEVSTIDPHKPEVHGYTGDMPRYTHYVSINRNVLGQNTKQMHVWPYFGSDVESDETWEAQVQDDLRKRFDVDVEQWPRKIYRAQQVQVYMPYVESFLDEIGCGMSDILYYLLEPDEDGIRTASKDCLSRNKVCEEDLDRSSTRWVKVFSKLQRPSSDMLRKAAIACTVFSRALQHFSKSTDHLTMWHIARKHQAAHLSDETQEPDIDPYSFACRICHLHDCPYHGEVLDVDNSSDLYEDDLDADYPPNINHKKRVALPTSAYDDGDYEAETRFPKRGLDWWLRKSHSGNHAKRGPFYPCSHPGLTCDEAQCQCFRDKVHCEKACACPMGCNRRFRGCSCKENSLKRCLQDDRCECFRLNRECDPDVCGECGVDIVLDRERYNDDELLSTCCRNAAIQHGRPKRTVLGASKVHGFGLFAGEAIKAHDFLGEYVGEIIPERESERRGIIYEKQKLSYVFLLNKDQELDSQHYGNKIRFINHAAMGDGLRNVYPKVVFCNMAHRIGMFALKPIAAGEELFFNYGRQYHKRLFNGRPDESSDDVQSKTKTLKSRSVPLRDIAEDTSEADEQRPGRSRTQKVPKGSRVGSTSKARSKVRSKVRSRVRSEVRPEVKPEVKSKVRSTMIASGTTKSAARKSQNQDGLHVTTSGVEGAQPILARSKDTSDLPRTKPRPQKGKAYLTDNEGDDDYNDIYNFPWERDDLPSRRHADESPLFVNDGDDTSDYGAGQEEVADSEGDDGSDDVPRRSSRSTTRASRPRTSRSKTSRSRASQSRVWLSRASHSRARRP